jgi:hypothetical protein
MSEPVNGQSCLHIEMVVVPEEQVDLQLLQPNKIPLVKATIERVWLPMKLHYTC